MRLLFAIALCTFQLFGQAPAAPAKPAAAAPRVVPPARIRDFKASSIALQPGQSTTLQWNVENPNSTRISGLGNVTAVGSRRVTPKATTTYTLTVTGPNNQTETRSVTITVAGTKPVDAAVAEGTKPTPRLADGKPDLTGIYNPASFSQMFGGRVTRGQNDPFTAKLKPGAEKYRVVRGPEDTGQFSDCMPTAVPNSYFVPYQWQIVHSKDYVVIMYEYPHVFRAIPIASANNPAEHAADPDPTWTGNSVAHWEGDTLVVDVIGFNDKTELPGGFRHTEDLHVIERFTRTSYDDLDYEAIIEDKNVFVEPWTIKRGFPLRADLQTLNEFVCENNRNYKELFEKK